MSLERYHYKGCVILVEQDDDPTNPRKEFDNAGTMICSHSRYDLGDVEKLSSGEELRAHMGEQCEGWDELLERQEALGNSYDTSWSDTKFWDEYHSDCRNEQQAFLEKTLIVLPLYLYDHSGITMNTGGFACGWDSGQVGYIFISRKKAVEEWGKVRCTKKVVELAVNYLKGEVETYDQYLTGAIYGKRVLGLLEDVNEEAGDNPQDEEWDDKREEIDSCWGFFGHDMTNEDGYMVTEAKGYIDYHIKHNEEKVAQEAMAVSSNGAGI
jgi:hypothetical protein